MLSNLNQYLEPFSKDSPCPRGFCVFEDQGHWQTSRRAHRRVLACPAKACILAEPLPRVSDNKKPVSLGDVLLSVLMTNDGKSAQQRKNLAKPQLKPLGPRPRTCAHASRDGDWWTVLSEVSGREYSIPSIHAARVSHGWLYEGLSREKAEELLLLPGNPGGAFLIRESQSRRGCYSLSVRLSRPTSWDRIRHYRIQRLDNGWLYISPRLTFPSLQALVDHYSELADDICCCLKEPCALQRASPFPGKAIAPPVTVQRMQLNWKELDSSVLFSEESATGEASLLSEGLREALSSYISLTEDTSLDDAEAQSTGRKGN